MPLSEHWIAMDRLSQLPEELVDGVCSYLLEKQSLQCLRMCCKRLEEKSRHAFYSRHLGVVRTMLSRGSLQKLIDLAKEERFQKAVRELEIVLVTFDSRSKASIHANPVTEVETKDFRDILTKNNLRSSGSIRLEGVADRPQPVPRHPQIAAFERGLRRKRRVLHDQQQHDQNTMRTTSTDVELLAKALRSLPALKAIRRVTQLDKKHPPLDARQLYNGMGIWPSSGPSREFQIASTHSVAVIFGAMLKSGFQPETIDFVGVPPILPLAKTPTSRKLSRTSTPAKTFAQNQINEVKWMKLRHLSLKLYRVEIKPSPNITEPPPLHWILPSLTRISSLRSLCLVGTRKLFDETAMHNLPFLELSLPGLHTLEIRDLDFKLEHLKRFLDTCRQTLKSFVCFGCSALHRDRLQVVWLLVDLPSLIYVDLSFWPRSYSSQHYTIDEKTPAEFQKRLKSILGVPT